MNPRTPVTVAPMSATTPQLPATARTLTQQLSSTRHGARLARLLTAEQLHIWPVPPDVAARAADRELMAQLNRHTGQSITSPYG